MLLVEIGMIMLLHFKKGKQVDNYFYTEVD